MRVEGLANIRDLGGIRRDDGSLTPARVYLRSEELQRVPPAGWATLVDYGVGTVIDLRRPAERVGDVPAGVDRVEVDLDGTDRTFWDVIEADGRWGAPLYYADHVRLFPDRLAAVLDAIAAAGDGVVLFHCGAGWDRTGLVAAVLLRAVGATAAAACADYMTTFANADPHAAGERHGICGQFGHTPESAFLEFYDSLDVAAWFAHAGVTPETRRAVSSWRGALDRVPARVLG